MMNLEYRIGKLDLTPHRLRFEGVESYEAPHKFVVEAPPESLAMSFLFILQTAEDIGLLLKDLIWTNLLWLEAEVVILIFLINWF